MNEASIMSEQSSDNLLATSTTIANGDTIEEEEEEEEEEEDSFFSTKECSKIDFDVIDDLGIEDDDEDDEEENYDGGSSSDDEELYKWITDDEDVPEDEIDALLEEKYESSKWAKRARLERQEGEEMAHEEREKVVLKVRGQDHFEVLPEGWIEVTHNSGMPVYLHKHTRVCTLSKPYFLGPGSARKHEVPITAIPCLQYRREIEKELRKQQKQQTDSLSEQQQQGANCVQGEVVQSSSETTDGSKNQGLPSAKIETVQENTMEKSISYLELREYCQKVFEFHTITVRRFKTWAGRRKHQKRIKQMHRPTLPLGTKLITCPLPPSNEKEDGVVVNPRRAEFVMNPNGKSYVCILHEYVQHAMRVQPRYIFRELENASTPYGATVIINDMEYGSGFGSSKKHAKSEAAKATLEILIPQMKNVNPDDKGLTNQNQDLAFFDEVRVEDPRVSELCAKAGQPSPYQILLECLKRNYGMGDTQIKSDMQTLKHQKNEFKMVVGKHEAKVICKNKRDGKQRASQAILQALHAHIMSWGSLLRLYGKGSCKTLKEKKQEEQQITELQCRTTANKPNQSILSKLREEMLKLKEKRELMKPIGKFQPTDVEPPSSSTSNLRNVDL